MNTPSIFIDDALCSVRYTLNMPYPGLFFFESAHTCRYFLQPQTVGEVISEAAAQFGRFENGLLVFELGKPECYPLWYELTKRLANDALNDTIYLGYQEELGHLRTLGYLEQPAYFGLYPPPSQTPLGAVDAVQRIFNGAYFAQTGERWLLALAEAAQELLPERLRGIGATLLEGYIFFDFGPWSAEVRHAVSVELRAALSSLPAIDSALETRFPLYAELLALWRAG